VIVGARKRKVTKKKGKKTKGGEGLSAFLKTFVVDRGLTKRETR